MLLVLILMVLVVAQARLVALVARLVALAVVLDRFVAQLGFWLWLCWGIFGFGKSVILYGSK